MTIYLLTNRITGLRYVGATTLTLPRRMGCHRRDAIIERRSTLLCDAIREHGWKSFDLAILGTTDNFDDLMRMERDTIAALGTLRPGGYNMASGGLGVPGCKASSGTKAKISAYRTSKSSWNKGVKNPTLSASRMGAGNPQARAVQYQAQIYGSIADAARATGLSVTQVRRRITRGDGAYVDTLPIH